MRETAELIEIKNSDTSEKTAAAIRDELRRDFADWMTTNEDLVCRPVVELRREGNEFTARTLVPGVDPKDVQVMVAPDVLLIKGAVHRGDCESRKLISSATFPRPVNPNHVDARIHDGMLCVRAEIAGTNIRMWPRAA
jgi:HSP20 family molecular chaperone IbpA